MDARLRRGQIEHQVQYKERANDNSKRILRNALVLVLFDLYHLVAEAALFKHVLNAISQLPGPRTWVTVLRHPTMFPHP